jgi:cell division protein FtsL
MNWLKILVGLSAIIIAGCAAYFSVTGLGVLFAGASVSVMVMASALELAKLVAATYLKQKWDDIGGFNKWYLTISVAVLMLITSAGIFGYLSNAFQAQSLQLQQVDREIAVHQTKIDQNTIQIEQLSTQITEFNTNQGKIIDGGKVNSRLLRSIDNRDKEIGKINNKISDLQTQNAGETEKINEIKIKNLDLEKEIGGFRFVAEAFGMELKNVVKFFIFLIVIVFDPLAVALIIAFNGLIETKKQKQNRLLGEIIENDQKLGLYEVYGDNKEDIVENVPPKEESIPNLIWEEFMHPDYPWNNKKLWINNPKAVQYWLNSKKGTVRELNRMKNDIENIKTY